MVPLRVVVCSVLLAVVAATNVDQCPGRSIEGLTDKVQLPSCKRQPCKLKKGTDVHVNIKFTPDHDIKDLRNSVSALVFNVPLPFVGVDGNSVCGKIETESGEKVSCPLKAGTTYVYKDSFPVLSFYPSITTKVHWALKHNDKDITCFEMPAQIK